MLNLNLEKFKGLPLNESTKSKITKHISDFFDKNMELPYRTGYVKVNVGAKINTMNIDIKILDNLKLGSKDG